MTTYMEQRDYALKAARDIAEKAKSEDRELTIEEAGEISAKGAEIQELNEKIKAARTASDLLASLGAPKTVEQEKSEKDTFGLSLGDYATTNLKSARANSKAQRSGTTASTAEYPMVKAPGDPHTVTTTGAGVLQPQIDTNVVHVNPQTKERTTDEEIAYLKHKIALQKQQIDALKKMNFIHRKAAKALPRKNINSSKH